MSNKVKLLASAQKYLQKGQLSRAIKDYQKLVELDPADIRNRQKLAELYGRDRRVAEAMEEFGAVARYYSDNGFYLKAIAVLKQIQRLDPSRVEIYHTLAELNEKQGLVGNALAEYRNLVAYHEKHHHLSEAIEVLCKMKELEPENLNLRVRIAETYAKGGLGEKAQAEFQEVLRTLQAKGDHAKVLKLHEIFLPLFPGADWIELGMGQALVRTDRFEKGLLILQRHLESDPDSAAILEGLALGYRKAGDFERAKPAYRSLITGSPGDLALRQGYVEACLDGGDHAGALEELEECKVAFLEEGRGAELKGYYERLRKALPGEERVAGTLSSILRHTADPDIQELEEHSGGEDPCEGIIEDLEEIVEGLEELEEEVPDPEEEIPLDFLDQGELLQEEAPEAPEEEEELELELELDLDLDFDLELEEGAAAPDEKIPSDPEEVSLDFELDAILSTPAKEGELFDPASELEEVEVYLQQGLLDEAEAICRRILERDPDCGEAGAKLEEIGARRGQGYFDLASEVLSEEFDLEEMVPGESGTDIGTRIDDDTESHYNLGIAYKEMGLLDNAVDEFDLAARNPARAVDSLTLKGICLVEKGSYDEAEKSFKSGLESPGITDGQRIGLHYELGSLYEAGGRFPEALECFEYVAESDPSFRNAGEKVRALRERLGPGAGDEGDPGREDSRPYA